LYKCDECDRWFGSPQALQQHYKSPAHAPVSAMIAIGPLVTGSVGGCCGGGAVIENAAVAEEDTIVEVALDELVEGGRIRSGLLI
jgi:Zinc-finger double-stranded RNA-binding